MPAKNHLHTYKRVAGSTIEFMCMDPDCTHRTHKKYLDRIRATCGACLEPFIMTKPQLRLANPHCNACTVPKNSVAQKDNDICIFEDMLGWTSTAQNARAVAQERISRLLMTYSFLQRFALSPTAIVSTSPQKISVPSMSAALIFAAWKLSSPAHILLQKWARWEQH